MSGKWTIKPPKLSPTMAKALKAMREHGGLKRLPGGFWVPAEPVAHGPQMQDGWFNTTTVEALVARRLADYTEWHEGGRSRFPIKCEATR